MNTNLYKFKEDYFVMTQRKWTFISGCLRCIKHRNLRFLLVSRLSCGHGLCSFFAELFRRRFEDKYGLEIKTNNIEGGLLLAHAFNITVNSKAVIGHNVTLFKGATIGSVRSGKRKGCPTIGNRVVICCNATVCGNITIGNDVLIAANSFVDFNVPDNSIVIGNPGRIYKKLSASKDYLNGL